MIETNGSSGDTRMWLYDADLDLIEYSDDEGTNLFSRIDRRAVEGNALPAGTYYVEIDEYGNNDLIANYNLDLQVLYIGFGDAFEPDGSEAQASTISSGVPQTHSISPANDRDYVSFSLSTPSEVVIETSGASGDTRMWLFGSDLSTIEFNDDGNGLFSRIDRTQGEGNILQPGTYYVLVDEFGNNDEIPSYEIRFDAVSVGSGDDAYEENDSRAQAWYGGFNWENTWLSGIDGLGLQSDEDWYRIDVDPGSERVVIDCEFSHAQGDIDIEIVNSAGDVVGFSEGTIDDEHIDTVVAGPGIYYIVAYYGNAGNSYDLWWDDLVPSTAGPTNDDFAARFELGGGSSNASGSNVDGTKEPGEPAHAGVAGGRSVWWSWVPAATGAATITTAGSNFDTLLAVYVGSSLGTLSEIASNDDDSFGNDLSSRVTFQAQAGTAYSIAVDGYNGAAGSVALHVIASETAETPLAGYWSSLTKKCKAAPAGVQCSLKGKVLLRNLGVISSAPSVLRFFLSEDASYDGADSQLAPPIQIRSLAPRKSTKAKLKVNLDAGFDPAGFYVLAVFGPDDDTVALGPLP